MAGPELPQVLFLPMHAHCRKLLLTHSLKIERTRSAAHSLKIERTRRRRRRTETHLILLSRILNGEVCACGRERTEKMK
jgi:hypothetical protein